MSRHKFDTQNLGAQLRSMREATGLLQREVAARCNVSANTITGWESGKRTPIVTDLDTYLKVVGGSMILGLVTDESCA